MEILIYLFIFLLGTIIGSFLNVVIYRLNTGRNIVKGRSMCMNCGRALRWYELFPIFSFLIQAGKCRRCKSKISSQYILVEAFTGLVFVLTSIKFIYLLDVSIWLYSLIVAFFVLIFSILIVIFVYDIKHKIIPDKLSYLFIFLSFLSIFINHLGSSQVLAMPNIYNLFAGPIIALPFVLIWVFSKGRLMGLGDGKLIVGIGWLLGLSAGVCSILLSFWIGTIVSLVLMFIYNKKMNMKTEIPFAPFLISALFITFFFNLNFFSLLNIF